MKYVLTSQGERYMSRVNAQMIQMHLLRVDSGSGVVDDPSLLTELTDPKQRLQIEAIEQDVNEAIIRCMLTNLELHEEYLLQQAGVWAYDSLENAEVLIFAGQDERGERIPAIEEREVQYMHNIAIKVMSTEKITFDVSVSDFVRKDYLEQRLKEHGRVLVGGRDTPINRNDILLIIEEDVPDQTFAAAGIENIALQQSPPTASAENWGKTAGVRIVDGRLVAAKAPDDDTTFLAKF